MVNQQKLNEYFSGTWIKTRRNTSLINFEKSGLALIDEVKPGESVIDVGCGNNPFKGKIPNLIGIDPAFDEADFKCTIDDFETDQKFDVAFCLGSINFGGDEDILRQIAKVISLLKPNGRIYWRCNPGAADHNNKECEDIPFYPWSLVKHVKYSEMFNCKLVTCQWDTHNRIYAVWARRD